MTTTSMEAETRLKSTLVDDGNDNAEYSVSGGRGDADDGESEETTKPHERGEQPREETQEDEGGEEKEPTNNNALDVNTDSHNNNKVDGETWDDV